MGKTRSVALLAKRLSGLRSSPNSDAGRLLLFVQINWEKGLAGLTETDSETDITLSRSNGFDRDEVLRSRSSSWF